ncbi:NAD(P)-dependent oxidoreductase [Microlunatus speluncae]|uniref:NAD(P)-dependent oxidoreductase n=1 Tax=Microlunatus speluncae TaxID=2594267 RepID=UPI00137560D2|nr:NAD(P)-dependent oxidoreductase [Microlunatus speluncae]
MSDRLIVILGDPMISAETVRMAFHDRLPAGWRPWTQDWAAPTEEVIEANRLVERGGPDAFRPPWPELDDDQVGGVITHFYPLPRALLSRWPRLDFVATLRAGTEHIDTAELDRRGVTLIRNTGRNANAVAEFTVAAMLGQLRRLGEGQQAIRTGGWRPEIPAGGFRELTGRTIGLIGYGAVGSLVARRLSGFEPRLLVFDPWLDPTGLPAGAEAVALPDLLARAEIISLHARSTPETRHLIGPAELDRLRPDAILINTARAELVDEAAMIERLVDGRLAGAALDVFGTEPLPADHVLRRLTTVALSPHVAGFTVEARTRAPALLADRVLAHLTRP